ncbi:hypothetical protein Tco_1497257, partial [Tanacetum coccineum]
GVLEKPEESDGFAQIVNFLNAHPINYALTVNSTIYTSCIKQFWATAKAKTVNGEVQIQALVNGKKVNVTEASVRRDLQLADENGTECLTNATNFCKTGKNRTTAWNEFSSTMASAVICLATNQKFNFSKYIFDNMVKNLEGGVKFLMYSRQGKDFSGRDTPLFQTMMVQTQEEEPMADEAPNDTESIPTHFNDPLLSGEDRLKLNELMELYTNLSQRLVNMENIKTSQAAEITKLKERVKKLERRNKSRTPGLKRFRKVTRSARIESSEDEDLGDQEDASKQGRKIANIDADEE